MIVVDTNFLILLLDPASTQDENRNSERVRHFVETLSSAKDTMIVAAPSLAELVAGRANRIDEIVQSVKGLRAVSIQPFDEVIAIETGDRIAAAVASMVEKPDGWKVAMKYDAMIAATAIVRGATAIYTTDTGIKRYLNDSDVKVVLVGELPLPPEDPQTRMAV